MTHSLADQFRDALRAIGPGRRYALVDYPLYNNPGDAAIWAGTRRLLEEVSGRPPAHVATLREFDPRALDRRRIDGPVFFLGGGNFGALHAKHHGMRLAAIRGLAGRRIVCLPFSTAELGDDPALLDETREVVAGHGEVTFLARERQTQGHLRDLLGVEAPLVPDAAHGLSLTSPPPEVPVVRLLREDRETLSESTGAGATDWRSVPQLSRFNRMAKLGRLVCPAMARGPLYDRIAERRVALAARVLGQGNVIETDRLHGLIIGVLLGRKVRWRDNATGKLSSYVETWGAAMPNIERMD